MTHSLLRSSLERLSLPLLLSVALSTVAATSPTPATAPKTDTAIARRKTITLAVLPLAAQGVDAASAKVLTEALADEVLRLKKVRVMERSQVDNLLKEQGFQQSGACDGSECAVQVGRILGIDLMVVGSLGKLGSTYTLSVRAVDVGTSEVVSSARRSFRGEIDNLLTEMIPLVAADLIASIPGVNNGTAAGSPAQSAPPEFATIVDTRDDQRYEWVRIGKLWWMTRNMNFKVSEFASWCYDDSPTNCNYLGRLYTWDKATLACPADWRLPTDREWDELAANLGGDKAGIQMHAAKGAKDKTLFKARAAGFRDPDGEYLGSEAFAIWWTATETDNASAYTRSLDFSAPGLGSDLALKSNGYSVRCVR